MHEPLSLESLYPNIQRLRMGSVVYSLLTDPSLLALRQRHVINTILHAAQQHGWIDTEAYGRLRAGDDAVVLSVIDELALARWFLQAGYELVFNPPGAGDHIGELLIRSAQLEVWVEAKSLLPSNIDAVMQSTQGLLHALAETIPLAARLIVEIDHHPGGGVSLRELKRYLHHSATQLLDSWSVPPAYTHPSGLYLRAVQCVPMPEAPHLIIDIIDDVWPGQEHLHDQSWRDRLWRTIRGGYSQLPGHGPATLILVIDHSLPYHPVSDWINPFYDMLRMGQHRNLSAIGRLLRRDLWLDQPRLTLLLNPNARATFPDLPLSPFPERRMCVLLAKE